MTAQRKTAPPTLHSRHLTVRNLPAPLAKELARERQRRGASLNQTVIDLLSASLGLDPGQARSNGLGKLAGSWTPQDLREFEAATADFARVDAELWK